jgi:outer membrane protein assembly factor BamB
MSYLMMKSLAPAARIAAALAILALLPACKGDGNPAMPGGKPLTVGDSVFGTGNTRWFVADTAGSGSMQPELDGTRVYFERELDITYAGEVLGPARLVALDRETGARLWANPIIAGKNAAVAGSHVAAIWGGLPIFERASGTPAGVYRYGSTSLSGNVVSDATRFYMTTYTGHAVAVNPATGAAEWDTNLAAGATTTGFGAALSGNALAVVLKHFGGSAAQRDSGIVAVLDPASGTVRWRRTLEASIVDPGLVDPPVIVGDVVIVVTMGHDVRAFDLQTGAPRWQADASYTAQEFGSGGLAACQGMVIVPTGDLGLVALDAATGQVRWRRGDLQDGSLFTVQCSHGTVMTVGGRMRVFDAATGTQRARYPIIEPDPRRDPFWINSVVRDERYLYVGSTFGWAKVAAP